MVDTLCCLTPSLGLEVYVQVTVQVLIILLANTETPTTGGLESFFKKDSFLGIDASPTSILTASVILSMTSAILRHVKALVAEKGFLTFKPKMTVFMCGHFVPPSEEF